MAQTLVITGASSGIGLALSQHYISNGDKVFAVCRSISDELESLSKSEHCHVVDNVDVTLSQGLATLKQALKNTKIDVLINNAGVLENESINALDFDSIDKQIQVNAIGPLRVFDAVSSMLESGAKIAMITSRMGSIADNSSGGYYGYRMSKAALNCATKSMSIDLEPKGIAVGIIHPGYVQTRMVGFGGDISADSSAQRIAQRISELNIKNTGTFWHSNGEVLPW